MAEILLQLLDLLEFVIVLAEWLKAPTHAASFFIRAAPSLFLHVFSDPAIPNAQTTAVLSRWALHLMT